VENKIVCQLDPSLLNARNSEATFVTLRDGRILLIWSKFIGDNHSDFGAGVIACRWSDDDGRTWSNNDRVLIERDERATNVMSPSALRLADGRIGLLYLRKEGHDTCIPHFCVSEDECRTFSPPVRVILARGYYVVNNDRMIQLTGGRLIIPVSICRFRGPSSLKQMDPLPGDTATQYPKGLEPFFAAATIIAYYFSDDGGRTWLESEQSYYRCFQDGSGFQEPGVIELRDGRLWSWSRSGHIGKCAYRQWQSFSRDRGQHWSEPEASSFISPCSPMQVKRIPKTGHLLAVWNDHSDRWRVPPPEPISWARTPLACAISADEGQSWQHHKLLEDAPDHGFCYPAIHFTNEAVLLSYNAGGASSRDPLDTQRVRRIGYDWLYQ
jgi:sialidase-1